MWKLMNGQELIAESVSEPQYIDAQLGWQVGGMIYADPAEEMIKVFVGYTSIGPIAFQLLFQIEELAAIEAAKATDPAIKVFFRLLDDPRTDSVDRSLRTVQDGVHYLEASGLIGVGRAQEILTGEVAK